MIGFVVGVLAALLLLALALGKPILARLGMKHAFQRPRQTALAVAGLMFATVVIGASAIAADSTRESFKDALVQDFEASDLVATSFVSSAFFRSVGLEGSNETLDETVAAHPSVRGHVLASTAALQATAPVENVASGLGRDDVALLGVDPSTWSRVMGWEPSEGIAPATLASWPEGGVLLDHRMAAKLDANVGDSIVAYLPSEDVLREVNATFNGTLAFATLVDNPTPVGPQGYVHSPADVYEFTWSPPNRTYDTLWFNAFPADLATPLHLFVVDGQGREFANASASPGSGQFPLLEVPGSLVIPPFQITIHSPQATDAAFTVQAVAYFRDEGEAVVLEGEVIGILGKGGKDQSVFGGGPSVVMPLPRLQEAIGQPDAASFFAFDLDDEVSAKNAANELSDSEDEAFSYVYFQAPKEELEEELGEIELATNAFFLGMGSFTLLSGFMLVFVLMALLVEERKSMLGTLRAVGGQRRDLTRMHAHEGSVYAISAAVAGFLGAAALAAIVANRAKTLLDAEDIPFSLHVQPGTVLSVLGAGFVFTLLVIALAAHRAVRIHIPSALRSEESPRRHRSIWLPAVCTVVGLLGTVSAFATNSATLMVLAPALLILGLAGLLARFVEPHMAIGLGGLGVAVYEAWTFSFIEIVDAETGILVPVRAALIVIAAAILAAYSRFVHAGVVRMWFGWPRGGAIAQNALSHLRHRPARAALTVAMLAMVLAVMTALGTLFATVAPQEAGDTGGYPVFGQAPTEFEDARAAYDAQPPRSGIDPFPMMASHFTVPMDPNAAYRYESEAGWGVDSWSFRFGSDVVGVTTGAANAWDYRAASLDPAYGSAREALVAVALDPGLAVVSSAVVLSHPQRDDERPVQVGDVLIGQDEARIRVIAVLKEVGTAGMFVHPSALMDDYGGGHWSRTYASPADGVSNEELRKGLEAGFRPYGMEAYTVNDINREEQYVFRAIQTLVAVFLGLGILVGMVSLALISVRNVHVRRPEIGVLRATGAQSSDILAMFAAENLYVTLVAVLIGVGVGLLMAYNVLVLEDFVTFTVDWPSLLALYGLTLAGAVVAALVPAWQASRIPPARAIRYVE